MYLSYQHTAFASQNYSVYRVIATVDFDMTCTNDVVVTGRMMASKEGFEHSVVDVGDKDDIRFIATLVLLLPW
jgi:hypothetical protein